MRGAGRHHRQRSQSWGLFGGGPGGTAQVEAGPGVVFDGDPPC